jgi:hypothetical protein
MRPSVKQLIALLFFAAQIGAVLVLRTPPNEQQKLAQEDALRRYGFYLTEVSKECGIDFVHQEPTLDPKLAHIMPIVSSMGASVTVVDFDRDGWPDLYVINSAEGSKNHLYHNLKNGKFEDVAEQMGIADLNQPGTGVCMGAVWGDFDNDGYEDLLVYKWGRPELYHNDQGKGFTRVTDVAGLPKWVNANAAVWFDYNRDGNLDLLIAGYWSEDLDLWHLNTTKIMPESFEYAQNGGRKYLLRNRGKDQSGKWLGFEDVTEVMGITSRRWTLAAAAADLRGTGYPDLFLANDYGVPDLYLNQEGKKFVEAGKEFGVAERPKSGMNASFGDILNDGGLAIYVSNITAPLLQQGNNLWVPQKDKTGRVREYVNLANKLEVERGGWSWCAQFGDLNNDGHIDIYLANGYISGDPGKDYWYEYSKVAGGNKSIISDAKNWPPILVYKDGRPIGNRSLSGYEHKCLWLNDNGRFIDIGVAVGVTDKYDGRSVALVDLWNRGVLDVVVANQNGPLLVYKNTVDPANGWVQFELEGTQSNRSAIGAQVRLFWNGHEQVQEVSGGCGYASQNQRRLHFGLGKDAQIDKVIIRWPSGKTQTIEAPQAGRLHKIKEPQ